MMNNFTKKLWDPKFLLTVGVVLLAGVVGYINLNNAVSDNTDDIAERKTLIDPVVKDLELNVPQIVQDIQYLQRDVTEVKTDIKEILKEVRSQ